MAIQGVKFGLLGVIVFGLMLLIFLPSDQSNTKDAKEWRSSGITHLVMFEFRANASMAQVNKVSLRNVWADFTEKEC